MSYICATRKLDILLECYILASPKLYICFANVDDGLCPYPIVCGLMWTSAPTRNGVSSRHALQGSENRREAVGFLLDYRGRLGAEVLGLQNY